MRLRAVIAILIVVSLGLAIFFSTRESDYQRPVSSKIPNLSAEYKNKTILTKKLDELDYYKNNKASEMAFVLSTEPQYTIAAQRMHNGQITTSHSYSVERTQSGTAKYILYVNPDIYPPADKAELERQYSQLALIALYQTSAGVQGATNQKNLLQFLKDYRADMKTNTIFSIR